MPVLVRVRHGGMMVSKWSLSAFVGDAVRNAVGVLAEAEWKAEIEYRLCGDKRQSMTKVDTEADFSHEPFLLSGAAIHRPWTSVEKQKSRSQ